MYVRETEMVNRLRNDQTPETTPACADCSASKLSTLMKTVTAFDENGCPDSMKTTGRFQ
jgi:hypothetical protein